MTRSSGRGNHDSPVLAGHRGIHKSHSPYAPESVPFPYPPPGVVTFGESGTRVFDTLRLRPIQRPVRKNYDRFPSRRPMPNRSAPDSNTQTVSRVRCGLPVRPHRILLTELSETARDEILLAQITPNYDCYTQKTRGRWLGRPSGSQTHASRGWLTFLPESPIRRYWSCAYIYYMGSRAELHSCACSHCHVCSMNFETDGIHLTPQVWLVQEIGHPESLSFGQERLITGN